MVHCKWFACLVLTCGMILGCEPQARSVVTNADDAVQVPLGATLEIVMAGNPSTGYGWELDAHDDTVLTFDGPPMYEPRNARVDGGGGMYTFAFTPEKAGEATLHFINRRPSDTSAEPAEEYTVTVEVLSSWPDGHEAPAIVRVVK